MAGRRGEVLHGRHGRGRTAWLEHADCHGQGTAAFWPDPAAYTAAVRHPHEAGDGTATHAIGTDEWSKRLGDERAARAWRCRDLRDAGARLALGSDWPIAHHDARQVLATARRPRGAAAG
ncbi:hypothetical protein GCM10014713_18370 [Streptomyces purpureus]|uniref:Amidohydrolase n=1 Tax=Streptomyces purpureus TaxID=1951 RepID=A0A918LMF1_9ACTN|nr:hypothetical protein GCM10014713_18370 [Streptomyces purpureus]